MPKDSKLRVLVVDDSSSVRTRIRKILSGDIEIEVIGEAADGRKATELSKALTPDIIIMDVVMPVLDGLHTITQIMAEDPVPILVLTSQSSADTAFRCISAGALEVLTKADVAAEPETLIKKIKLLSKVKVISHIRGKFGIVAESRVQPDIIKTTALKKIIAIASSTGGPKALSLILPGLPDDFPCPVVIAQHMSDGFITGLVSWLDAIVQIDIKIAEDQEPLKPAVVYFSPSEYNMEIGEERVVNLTKRLPHEIYHPSCDKLLVSTANAYGNGAMGIILSGMGDDGVKGIKAIKEKGGTTLAQDKDSSVVFGMNAEALKSGSVDKVLSVTEICKEIIRFAN
ncbi:MAG: chemotaxis-specific protein-glutamate methyltransferase CheB [Nitrospirae bacterium]|nr:chemotaxis-specific protein-glutamate methyltransferase CheB [Nitrospirota bacterium]MBF0535861.1 chemotaxis-specific protein-glutamate methyltransferase CheB [Nitrospirota bacterium]MBF0617805.1 chemotaxis-specific protein-glutamate methyltransferase CheB [Nitrospirota bacterium]